MRLKIIFMAVMMMASTVFGTFSAVAQDTSELTILYWQAASIVNVYLSGGTKDQDAMALVTEPLAAVDPEGQFVLKLATEIPTVGNGGVVHSEDSTVMTWNLRDDILWSDGTPFTSEDVVFTWEYCTNEETGCAYVDRFANISSVEADGDYAIVITFDTFKPYPYDAFVGHSTPIIQKAQFADCMGAAAQSCTEQNFAPIGTGPYMVEDFRANDVVTYVKNPNYRDADEGKPFFDRVIFKGGGDAESAARAVLETGEADYAWNLQISPEVLNQMEAAGVGVVEVAFGSSVERIQINATNPSPDCGDTRSTVECGPHPFLSNATIRQAMSMAIDRNIIAEQLYGAGGKATCNILNGPPAVYSPNTSCEQDIEGANALLDEAGIVDSDGDGIREYEGIPLKVLYQTSTNAVRQSTQALVKQWWGDIGIDTELRNIDGAVFFGGDPASPDTYQKFYSDVEMFTSSSASLDAQGFMVRWICGTNPSPENGWLGRNVPRYCSEEYDALYEELTSEADLARREELSIALNDTIIGDNGLIPLVFRGSVSARRNDLEGIGTINGNWDSEMWNVADWYRTE